LPAGPHTGKDDDDDNDDNNDDLSLPVLFCFLMLHSCFEYWLPLLLHVF